jgi:hypothetical protein
MPLDEGDQTPYLRLPDLEVILWLLTAASSGVVGNLAYDAVKTTVARARKHHKALQRQLMERRDLRRYFRSHQPRAEESRVIPTTELRDDLVALAFDALRRYQDINKFAGTGVLSEVAVTMSSRSSWKVHLREVGSSEGVTVEIDLSETMSVFDSKQDHDGFPVILWL